MANKHKGPERSNRVPAEQARRAKSIAHLQEIVARKTLNTDAAKLIGPGREEPRVTYRQLAMVLSRELTGATLEEIAAAFKVKDHNTVRHALAVLGEKKRHDKDLGRLSIEIAEDFIKTRSAA